MSDLKCISDDLEEEIVRGIQAHSIRLVLPDFNWQDLAVEIRTDPIRTVSLVEANKLLIGLAATYVSYTAQLVNALGIKPDEAEQRMKSRTTPKILEKMEENEPQRDS